MTTMKVFTRFMFVNFFPLSYTQFPDPIVKLMVLLQRNERTGEKRVKKPMMMSN